MTAPRLRRRHPTITGTVVSGDTPNFTESYDTKNAGTGKTLTATGVVNDGNGGNNYAVTFVSRHQRRHHGARHHGDGGDEHQGV